MKRQGVLLSAKYARVYAKKRGLIDCPNPKMKIISQYSTKLTKFIKSFDDFKYDSIILLPQKPLQIDSNILRAKGNLEKDICFLVLALDNPVKIELLFRGSQHAFRATQFHKKCDSIQNTLVLIRSSDGKTVGGFTHYTWNPQNGFVSSKKRNAFLLQLDLYEKMVPITNQNLIYCRENLGPWFGGMDPDLGVIDSQQGFCKFPTVYNKHGLNGYKGGQKSYAALTGTTTGWKFKIAEYEVFKVIYE